MIGGFLRNDNLVDWGFLYLSGHSAIRLHLTHQALYQLVRL